MIICSTVDQAGSRLLFRGYGVSDEARPIHAALLAQDSLLIVDEAHISRPFVQTVEWVARYRQHSPADSDIVRLPFQLIQMTATLPATAADSKQISLTSADRDHPVLQRRLAGEKRAQLVVEERAKGKNPESAMAIRLAFEAKQIFLEHKLRSLVVMVNRVATARAVAEELNRLTGPRVTLLIGRLRPCDREALTRRIQDSLATGADPAHWDSQPEIVVSTQCLEVGADLDFDVLVTEAASLDALRQRFGRLNRAGRPITARAVIVLPGCYDRDENELDDMSPVDPIYGNAIPRTWHWLQSIAEEGCVDFGIDAMAAHLAALRETSPPEAFARLLAPTGDAPVLLPAYLDCWVQTNPAPAADPDVSLFLHGPRRDMAEVQVCWRADLPADLDESAAIEIVSLCPPTSAECLPVPLHIFRNWIGDHQRLVDTSSDAEAFTEPSDRNQLAREIRDPALLWEGPENSRAARQVGDFVPGCTVVLSVWAGGWNALGVLPESPADPDIDPEEPSDWASLRSVDVAERGLATTRRRAVLRVHPNFWPASESGTAAHELLAMATDSERGWLRSDIKELLERLAAESDDESSLSDRQRLAVAHLAEQPASHLVADAYPGGRGFVITTRALLPNPDAREFENLESEPDALLESREPIELGHHTRDVLARLEASLTALPLDPWREALVIAAERHDWGKADRRFQAILRSSSVVAAMASGVVLAKSAAWSSSATARHEAARRAGLPRGFRHEMLSLCLAEAATGQPSPSDLRSLVLHLIATHHGHGRPFAPVVLDDLPPDVSVPSEDGIESVTVTTADRLARPAHALDSGVAERFWQLTRRHGWWGLAFLETVLRLADQQASAQPQPSPRHRR